MPASLPENVAANARRARERRGLTQEVIAAHMDVYPRYLRAIEAATVNLTLATLAKLAAALGTDAYQLLKPAKFKRRPAGRPARRTSGR